MFKTELGVKLTLIFSQHFVMKIFKHIEEFKNLHTLAA